MQQYQVGTDILARNLEEQLLEVQARELENASCFKAMEYSQNEFWQQPKNSSGYMPRNKQAIQSQAAHCH